MCIKNLKPLKIDKAIKAWKVVARLTDGRLVSIKGHLKTSIQSYEYLNGLCTKHEDSIGLHTYKNREYAETFAETFSYIPSTDVESMVLLSVEIPANAKVEIGEQVEENEKSVGYISDILNVDTTPVSTYTLKKRYKLGSKDFHKRWDEFRKLTKELGIF